MGQFIDLWGRTSRGSLALESPHHFGTLCLLHSGGKAPPANGLRTHGAHPALLQWLFLCNRLSGCGHVLSPPRAPREDLRPCPLLLPKFSGQDRSWILELGGRERGVFL